MSKFNTNRPYIAWKIIDSEWVSEWVIKFDGISGDSRQQGPYSPYKRVILAYTIDLILDTHSIEYTGQIFSEGQYFQMRLHNDDNEVV